MKKGVRGVKEVFSNLRGNERSSNKSEIEVQELLEPHDFFCGKLMRHGFPYQPTCTAWDPIQKLLAIGTKHGVVRLLGRPGVDITMVHDGEPIIIRIIFLINEGAFITACSDDSINLWSYRQKTPEIVHSLKFSRERITYLHLPFHSKWLYVGTERGNVHLVNVETFTICGYTINWNKAIELSRKTHPGPVVHLSDNPMDSNKLLIGFETGLIICWDLRCKMAEFRFNSTESLRDACWHQEGKLFMCSYADGTLSTWNFKQQSKPVSIMTPHSKANKSGSISPCKPINRVEWKTLRASEPYVIFSGGMSFEASKSPCLTIMHGKDVTVLEMEHKIIDFVVLCKNLYSYDFDEPYAIVVLLSSDLIFVDLTTTGYPCFQCPYSLDIHESAVTCLKYISDCASDLIPAIYSSGTKQKRKGFSSKEFPVTGGEASVVSCSYTELLITGHADGTVKFWDVSGASMQFLYRMKTNKHFEKLKRSSNDDEDVLAIQHIYLDEDSRLLVLAAAHHITLFNYSKKETTCETAVLHISAINDLLEETGDSPTLRNHANNGLTENLLDPVPKANPDSSRPVKLYRLKSAPALSNHSFKMEVKSALKAKTGARKHAIGYQPQLIVVLQWCEGATPPIITCICVNSSYGMLAVGTTNSVFITDILQNTVLLNVMPYDLCNSEVGRLAIPNSKSRLQSASSTEQEKPTESTSDNTSRLSDQMPNGCPSPGLSTKQKFRWKTPVSGLRLSKAASFDGNEGGVNSSSASPVAGAQTSRDKPDGVFSRSRSPSTSSLDIAASSEVQFLTFADSYSRKQSEGKSLWSKVAKVTLNKSKSHDELKAGRGDLKSGRKRMDTTSSLWIGTNTGTLMALDIIPSVSERTTKPVMVAHSGTTFQLKGTILELCFLTCKGFLVPVEAQSWGENRESVEKKGKGLVSRVSRLSASSADGLESAEQPNMHIATMCSDSEVRSVALPSQTVLFKEKFPDGMFVIRAESIVFKESACLACLGSNGNLMVYSLPSLKALLSFTYFNQLDIRVVRTLEFSNHGHALYMCSANELQKITVSADMCRAHPEMQCEAFIPRDNPEAPKQNFLKSLFGSGPSTFDREELFGSAGKASHGIATHVPGAALRGAQANASGLAADMAKTRMALDERGEKLGRLDERSEAMKERAREFSNRAALVADKYKNLKWYQF